MAQLLMPKATAVWLVENTTLTFNQIADFCQLHPLQVQAIADGDVAVGMHGLDPVAAGQLTQEEIDRCAEDQTARLEMAKPRVPETAKRPKTARYTPVSKRQERPDAIAWLVKNYPEMSDGQISKLIGTTKPTIGAVRDKSHWNASNIRPQNPVHLGLCSITDLEKAIAVARLRAGTVASAETAETVAAAQPEPEEPEDMLDSSRRQPEPTVESVFGPQPPKE